MNSTILSLMQKGCTKMAFQKIFFVCSLINIIVGDPILNAKQRSMYHREDIQLGKKRIHHSIERS